MYWRGEWDRYAQRKADDGFFEAEEKAVGRWIVRRTGPSEESCFADAADVIQLRVRKGSQ